MLISLFSTFAFSNFFFFEEGFLLPVHIVAFSLTKYSKLPKIQVLHLYQTQNHITFLKNKLWLPRSFLLLSLIILAFIPSHLLFNNQLFQRLLAVYQQFDLFFFRRQMSISCQRSHQHSCLFIANEKIPSPLNSFIHLLKQTAHKKINPTHIKQRPCFSFHQLNVGFQPDWTNKS